MIIAGKLAYYLFENEGPRPPTRTAVFHLNAHQVSTPLTRKKKKGSVANLTVAADIQEDTNILLLIFCQ